LSGPHLYVPHPRQGCRTQAGLYVPPTHLYTTPRHHVVDRPKRIRVTLGDVPYPETTTVSASERDGFYHLTVQQGEHVRAEHVLPDVAKILDDPTLIEWVKHWGPPPGFDIDEVMADCESGGWTILGEDVKNLQVLPGCVPEEFTPEWHRRN